MSGTEWKEKLGLDLHPEGGYFKRIYTSQRCHLTLHGERALVTSIYYLLDGEQPLGRLHRNRSDILHFFLDGDPVDYVVLGADGALRRERLDAEQRFLLVPGGCWKASRLAEGSAQALVSEVVAPGFDYDDHEFATEAVLGREHPQHLQALAPFLTRRAEPESPDSAAA